MTTVLSSLRAAHKFPLMLTGALCSYFVYFELGDFGIPFVGMSISFTVIDLVFVCPKNLNLGTLSDGKHSTSKI